MDKYSPVLTMHGDPERGKKTFDEATCVTCHKFQDIGERIGPDLETLIDRSPKTLIVAVIDPNRACIDRYVEYVAVTNDGLTFPGMLLEETSNSITLVDTDGKQKVILRKDIDELVFTGRSHMSEGLEAKMNLQQMADLFAFVGGAEPPPRQLAGNKPQIIVRGDDTAFTMRASSAEIYGDDIKFDAKAGSVASWTGQTARVAWKLRNFVTNRTYDVWIDYACDNAAAGKPFIVQLSNRQTVKAKTQGTGGEYRQVKLGQVTMRAGEYKLSVLSESSLTGELMNLRGVRLVPAGPVVRAQAFANKPQTVKQAKDGAVQLGAIHAKVNGPGVVFEGKYGNLGCWYKPQGHPLWTFEVRQGGQFELWLDWACMDSTAGNAFQVQLDKAVVLEAKVPGTGSWDKYRQQKFGSVQLEPGNHSLVFRAGGPIKSALIDLRGVKLLPAKPGSKK